MANMLPQNERDEVIAWVRRGAEQEEYTTRIGRLSKNAAWCVITDQTLT